MIDWDALLGAAEAAPSPFDEIKQRIKPAQLLVSRGVDLFPNGDRLYGLCPFHQDHDPSLAVFGENLERWGCWSCGVGGDVIDLLRQYDIPVGEWSMAAEMLNNMPAPPAVERQAPVDFISLYETATHRWPVDLYVQHREFPFSADWLMENWGVRGRDNGRILIPYTEPQGRGFTGLKWRDTTTKPISVRGSNLSHLYGIEKDRGRSAILCEGESDTWVASYHFPDHDVFGLPTGANGQPVDLEIFAGRRVYLWFDGDGPGRDATARWAGALLSCSASVFVIPMADGCDLAGLSNVTGTFHHARPYVPYNGPIAESQGVLVRNGRNTATPISDWCFTPTRALHSTEGSAYEGTLNPRGITTVLTTPDLSSATALTRWANTHDGAWFGSTRDAQELLAYLHSTSVLLPAGQLTRTVGLHEDSFVLPNQVIGSSTWRYAPPVADIGLTHLLGGQISTTPNPSKDQLDALFNLHEPDVLHPILAWFGAAPMRSTFREFPILMVSGPAGTGKTTLVETLLRVLAPGIITTNLTSTTPYAIDSFVAATNAFPVWFDEYRPGGRKDTIERLNQIMRDAYTSQPSFKGGASVNLSELRSVVPSSPILVSGEDLFSETSHLERSIVVGTRTAGRNADALRRVAGMPQLWGAYADWLLRQHHLHILSSGRLHDNPRINTNLNRVRQGWHLLTTFLEETYDYLVGRELELTGVTASVDAATSSSPILEMLRWAVDQQFEPYAWVDKDTDELCVSLRNTMAAAARNTTFTLPGGYQAIKQYLFDVHGGRETRGLTPWGNIRYIRLPNASDLV